MTRRFALLLVLACLPPACGSSLQRKESISTPRPEKTSVGGALANQFATPKSTLRSTTESLVLVVVDRNHLRPSGIPVRISGPQNRTVATDARGEVRISGPPGVYHFRVVEGCGPSIQVLAGGYADEALVAGRTTTTQLPVTWRHRYAPAPPVIAPHEWKVGASTDVRYDVVDRCRNDRARGVSFPTYAFRTSANVKVVGTPTLRSDGAAHAHVTVSCTKPGRPGLVAYDRANPPDSFDMVRESVGFGGEPRCVS